jgi:hypothetical protein
MLFELQQRTGVGSTDIVHDYEAIVWIRNCIAHSAGIQEYYEFQDELAEAVNRLAGFTLDGWHFLGKHVCIERGALKAYIRQIGDLIVMLYKATDEQGLLHDEPQAAASGREKPAC